ncbi:MAG TPA: DUF1697 domain-containing protein [Chitinivibrionales bacterium]|nr:DUF1697 domain-containing protein [Chitinivibrionales bacterium]
MIVIALLRGINVGGSRALKMQDLIDGFESLGYKNAATYLQSGNVIFDSPGSAAASLEKMIGSMILKRRKLEVNVVVRTVKQWDDIIRGNPFLGNKNHDPAFLHVTFLNKSTRGTKIELSKEGQEDYRVSDREIYLYCPNGYGRTKMNNQQIEKKTGLIATTRNWNTVLAIRELAQRKDR